MLIWLYSFLVQSTLFLGATWLLLKLVPRISLRSREIAWNTAILAALVGPALHVLWPNLLPTPWQLPQGIAMTAPVETAVDTNPILPPELRGRPDDLSELLHRGNYPPRNLTLAVTPAMEDPDLVAAPTGPGFWSFWLTRLWVIGACLSLMGFAWRYTRFQQLLVDRTPVLDGHVRLMLDRLRLAAGLPRPIRLTSSTSLGSPVAIGVGRNAEICLPMRALESMPAEQVRAMLGHEVAHHMRRDPVHLIALNLLQALFFFQPLLRVARADLHQIAEQQCDAWGSHQAGDRWSMARCLAEVATWLLPADATHVAAGMARKRSQLTTRVRSLMDENHDADAIAGAMGARKHLAVAGLALIAAPFFAPQVVSSPPNEELDSATQSADPLALGDSHEDSNVQGHGLFEQEPAAEAGPVWHPKLGPDAVEFLTAWDLNLAEVQYSIYLIRTDLGPLVEHPRFKSKVTKLENHLHTLMRMRNLLEQILILLSSEDGPSSEGAANH